jgi:NADP-dependent 3-hydroxy acid dehydrogenase YdfG
MVGSKAALRLSLDAVKRDYPAILFSEIIPGKTRTNMLKQNYQDTKTDQEIEQLYEKDPYLLPEQVAQTILTAINLKLEKITISPRDAKVVK